jgi:hypothetical protein
VLVARPCGGELVAGQDRKPAPRNGVVGDGAERRADESAERRDEGERRHERQRQRYHRGGDERLDGEHVNERRFGHVFLIRAAGRSAGEMLVELRRRLDNDDARERTEVTDQLAQITRLRLETLLAG